METNIVALYAVFKLCYGQAACIVEPYEPPCMVKVTVMQKVETEPHWWNWPERQMMVMKDQRVIEICKQEVNNESNDSESGADVMHQPGPGRELRH